ncbi:MAG: DUF5011 domain-containing protein [Akkermansiaceae bacterium]|nr:DUF5011 domain-containing protein [Akkermansiaceae bacterium]
MKPKLLLLSGILFFPSLHAAELTASDGAAGDYFGGSLSLSGSIGIVGAEQDDYKGSAYVFRDLDTASGTVTQNVKLTASDGAAYDRFGTSVSLSGSIGLVGAFSAAFWDENTRGSAYVFRNLNTASGTITQNTKLTASDGAKDDFFGTSVSLFGSIGLVGAYGDDSYRGSAYIFRNLNTVTGSITQNVKLTASDGAASDLFGTSVSLAGTVGLVGAYGDDGYRGSAYVFRNLHVPTGSVTQNVKLTASDGEAFDEFGVSVSVSGSIGLVGASGDDDIDPNSGAAYVFRNLGAATGTITQNAKLTASDGAAGDYFGYSVSLSDSIGLIGAYADDDNGTDSGSAYLFRNLDTATGAITQNLKLTAGDSMANDRFGWSVSLDGDLFTIGAYGRNSFRGKAYTGSVSSLTTLDLGAASRTISGISFVSQEDWIIGRTTDDNTITLSSGSTADVTASGKAVHIGMDAGSDGNTLIISGNLYATEVNVGSTAGNAGNVLQFDASANVGVWAIRLTADNLLRIQGDHTADPFAYLGATALEVWNGGSWQTVTPANRATLLSTSYGSGYTTLTPILSSPPAFHASELTASDGTGADYFGYSVGLSGSIGLVGAYGDGDNGSSSGSVYVFRNLGTATGSVTQNAKLIASDGTTSDEFGWSVSLSGSIGLVGAIRDDDKGTNSGSAYVFRSLDTATGAIIQNAKLTASDGSFDDHFGWSVSLSGPIGLVGTQLDDFSRGSAYVFRNLDTATGTITQNVKLTASDGTANDRFGYSVGLSGNIGLVGAVYDDAQRGSAYVFRNLDTATGSVTQDVKLTASDGAGGDHFGYSVSLSGSTAIVGAYLDDDNGYNSGSAYVFHNLDTATGFITENVRLTASDGAVSDYFGCSVSLSGSIAIVGAYGDDDNGNASGSAYLFRNLDTATGTVTQNVKLTASDGAVSDWFGCSVSLDGDLFIVGAVGKNSSTGKAYTGSVSSLTTLDPGAASGTISGISFVSQEDWIIGRTTDNNTVTLSAGNTADVTASGKAVFIGMDAGADDNALVISGTLNATEVYIGSTAGNAGNVLQLDASATVDAGAIRLTADNSLRIQGDHTADPFAYLGSTALQVWSGGSWQTVTPANRATLLATSYGSGYTTLTPSGMAENLPPVVTLNGANPITLECYVDFYTEHGATAVDPEDGSIDVVITDTVDRTHVGTYTNTYTATDSKGLSTSVTRTIHVVDTRPPVITVPANILIPSVVKNPSGPTLSNPVFYAPTVTASDVATGNRLVTLSHPTGTRFPVGRTTVTAMASDPSGNTATTTFDVIVLEHQESPGVRFMDVIAYRGEPATGAPLGTIFNVNRAFVNNRSDVIYDAALSGAGANDTAVFYGPLNGAQTVLAVKGTASGVGNFGAFSNLTLNHLGDAGFESLVGSTPAQFRSAGGAAAVVSAAKSGAAPTGGGEAFSTLYQPAMSSNGLLLTPATLQLGSGAGVTVANDTLLVTSGGGVLAREGSPTGVAGVSYGQLHPRVVASRANEKYAFSAFLETPVFDPDTNTGLFVGTVGGGAPDLVVREGNAANGVTGARIFQFLGESVNSAGEIAFRATITGTGVTAANNDGIWSNSGAVGSPPVLVARKGAIVPLAPANRIAFSRFTALHMQDDGSVVFHAFLQDATAVAVVNSNNDGSIWRWSGGRLTLLAREGDLANNTAGGRLLNINGFDCNDMGGIVYDATLVPGVGDTTTATNQAVFINRGNGLDPAPLLAMRRNDSFEVMGAKHIVAGIKISTSVNSGGGTGGYGRAINDSGEVVFNLTLSGLPGPKSGIFLLGSAPN